MSSNTISVNMFYVDYDKINMIDVDYVGQGAKEKSQRDDPTGADM
ncbi:hypothetical protein QO002_002142 [Pararhizobium capsulatum DSM 1112]|uniref:Uncharacterized protein n=1 Tax=Pararhizobium capsulatum DSM 1112 TaxID=1121113 RepID=A0ABU0BQH8_9HYPH|nr:hypothetical protein [Pararhizobium capsulatum]MDQ0320004.1 hypothetical protein [Pararhizobium capsulatum DSM 1112]